MIGKTIISEEVFVELAKTALSKVDSVFIPSMYKRSFASIARIVAERVAPQISVKKADLQEGQENAAAVSFEIKVNVIYGKNIPAAIASVREAVREEVESITGYQVEKIDVIVEKLIKPESDEANTSETVDIIDMVEKEE